MPPIVALDCETFGLYSRRSPILQLGAVWTNEHEEIIDRAEWNIIPESVTVPDEANRLHDPKALARNGIVMEEHMLTALPAAQVWEEFSLRFHKHRSVIQPFAVGFQYRGVRSRIPPTNRADRRSFPLLELGRPDAFRKDSHPR